MCEEEICDEIKSLIDKGMRVGQIFEIVGFKHGVDLFNVPDDGILVLLTQLNKIIIG